MSVEPGKKAPDFTLPTDGAGSVTLSELSGKKVVLYFYPKDDTSGFTAETDCGALAGEAAAILATADPVVKAAASRALADRWGRGTMALGRAAPPPHPARPQHPLLRPPREMPKRRAFGSRAGRIALVH